MAGRHANHETFSLVTPPAGDFHRGPASSRSRLGLSARVRNAALDSPETYECDIKNLIDVVAEPDAYERPDLDDMIGDTPSARKRFT